MIMLKSTEERFRRKLLEDIDSICKFDDKLFLEEDKFESIFELYQRYRDVIHGCINQGSKKAEQDVRMDRHKIATAFFFFFLKARPIGKKADATKFLERTVNEQLALIFSVLFVIDTFNVSDHHEFKVDEEIFGLPIIFPECSHSEIKDYKVNFIMLIDETQQQLLDIDSDKFQASSLFVISHLFFLLDAFSYEKNYNIVKESGFAS
jgi:hypothetical protein